MKTYIENSYNIQRMIITDKKKCIPKYSLNVEWMRSFFLIENIE